MAVARDLTGKRFGRLVVLCREESTSSRSCAMWKCLCDCGNVKIVASNDLTRGHTQSCGCLAHDLHVKRGSQLQKKGEGHSRWKHGGSVGGSSRLYRIWGGMKTRCYNPNSKHYDYYGGRGIAICTEWLHNFAAFQEWALSNGYHEGLSIDRIDNDKGYSPDNCRWITQTEQNKNRRYCKKKTPLCEPGSNTEGSR